MQGQSLASLLLGESGWQARPVILEEFEVEGGRIEVIDGRWGASLQIDFTDPDGAGAPSLQTIRPGLHATRPVPLLLCDLWSDPECRYSLHDERPDLVARYAAFLEEQLEADLVLADI